MATIGANARSPNAGMAQLSALSWLEPLVVVGTMVTTVIVTRRKTVNDLERTPAGSPRRSEDGLLYKDGDASSQLSSVRSQSPGFKTLSRQPPYAIALFNRVLSKFPFLVELFYWILNYAAYQFSKAAAASLHSRARGSAVVELAQNHGISILSFEHESAFKSIFSPAEVEVQHFLMKNHPSVMTVLNQVYSLVHIPGTVLFISWYYYSAPNHNTFAVVRRAMNLANFMAFFVFALYPCMPPRLLPKRFGFTDTVRQAHAESVWVGDGKSVNQLAAMPSLHFTYALTIGLTFFWHSGLLQQVLLRGRPQERKSFLGMIGFVIAGALYPMLVLLVIVATANHYYLDAVMATLSVAVCFFGNRIWLLLMPAERLMLRVLMLEKPVPTTGDQRRRRYVQDDSNCYSDA